MIQAYADYVAKTYPVYWIQDRPWRVKNRILEPIAPPHSLIGIEPQAVRSALQHSKAMLARWNDGWDTAPCAWWWICCDDQSFDLERLSRRGRRGVRRGLASCEVRPIAPALLQADGYDVYRAAHRRYPGHVRPADEAIYREQIQNAEQSGCYENWGCFTDGRLAAYARCIVIGDAVIMSEVKSDPDLLGARPNHALIFTLTRTYMQSGRIRYVTDGSRSVHHETSFQDFLLELGYRQIFCPLRLAVTAPLDLALRWHLLALAERSQIGRIVPGLGSKITALTTLWSISEACAPIAGDVAPALEGDAR